MWDGNHPMETIEKVPLVLTTNSYNNYLSTYCIHGNSFTASNSILNDIIQCLPILGNVWMFLTVSQLRQDLAEIVTETILRNTWQYCTILGNFI